MSLLAGAAEAARARPQHLVLAATLAGLLVGSHASGAVVVLLALSLGAAAAALTGPAPHIAVVVIAAVLVAGWAGAKREQALEHTELGGLFGHVTKGRVTVLQAPRPQSYGGWTARVRYRGEPVLLRAGADRDGVRSGHPSPPAIGEVFWIRAAVRAPDAYARILRAHAVLRLLARSGRSTRRGGTPGVVDGLRQRAEWALAQGSDRTRAALRQGMVLGQDAGLPQAVHDEVRAAGLSHLTAASGANIVLLATLVVALARVVGLSFHARWLLVLGLIVVYVPLAGGGPSIQRAGVMGAAGVVAILAGRPSSRWYALGLAAVVTLAVDPRAVGDPGWQMSFAAVVALITLAAPWSRRLARRGVPVPAADALAVTAAATLATAPIIALRFGTLAPLSLPANLLVAPVVAAVMWLGFTAALVGQVLPPLAVALDRLSDPLLRWILWVAHITAGGPGAGMSGSAMLVAGLVACVLAAVGVQAVPRLRMRGGRRVPLTMPAVVLALALVGTRVVGADGLSRAPAVVGFRVTFLDVGQGDATLLQVPGHAVLVDTGPPESPLLSLLAQAGVHRLDTLVITHAQADHDGGAAAVLAAMRVGLVLDGRDGVSSTIGDRFAAVARHEHVRLLAGRAGQVLSAGALTLRVLGPGLGPTTARTGADPNQRAIVAEAEADGARVLLTADAESDVLAGLDVGPVDLLKVAHHGSADPGLPTLLDRLRPLIAGIEVGAHNSYGHPATPTVAALRAVPRTVRTDRDGTIRLDRVAQGWAVHVERAGAGAGA